MKLIQLVYSNSNKDIVLSFVNNIKTVGFRSAITLSSSILNKSKDKEIKNIIKEDTKVIISIRIPKSSSSYFKHLVQKFFPQKFNKYFEENPIEAEATIFKIIADRIKDKDKDASNIKVIEGSEAVKTRSSEYIRDTSNKGLDHYNPIMPYDASNIKVLKGLEAVRKRPSMYIGDTSNKGLHHLIYEVVDNSIDEYMAGYCTLVKIVITKKGSVVVEDNGRGIPVAEHPTEKISAATVVLTVLHAGGKFDKDTYKVSGGLHGVGISVVNALSNDLKLLIKRDGHIYEQNFKKGIPQDKLIEVGKTNRSGTKIEFYPDESIFTETIDFQKSILIRTI